MSGIGFWEIVIVILVAILVVNPRDIPEILHKLRETLGNIKNEISNLQEKWKNYIKPMNNLDNHKDIK